MKKLYTGFAALFFLGLALTVFASSPDPGRSPGKAPAQVPAVAPEQDPSWFPGPMGMGMPPRPPHFPAPCLNLTRAQLDKAKELENRFFNETRDLRYEISIKRLEMRKLFTDPHASEAALYAKQKELNLVEGKLHEKMAQMHIEGRKILTSEQIRKLDRAPMVPHMPPPPPPGPARMRLGMLDPQ